MSDAAVQPWLGEECLWPERPDVVCLVSEKRWLKTGKIIGKNEQLCRAVCIDLLVGELSQRQIADRYGIGRGSIRAIEDIMRARGELEPLSKVVRAELGRAIVLGLWRWNEGLLDGTVHPGQVPIPTAALIDKRAQLEAGIVPGTQRTTGEVTVEQLRAEIAMARALQAPAGDSQADAGSLKLDQISSASGSDTGMDTAGPHRTGPTPGAAGDLDAAGGGSGLGAVPDVGGGDRPLADHQDTRRDTPESFQP